VISPLLTALSYELNDLTLYDGTQAPTQNAGAWQSSGDSFSQCSAQTSFQASVSGVPYDTPQLYLHNFGLGTLVYAGIQVTQVDFIVTRMEGTLYSLDADPTAPADLNLFGYAPNGMSGQPRPPSNGTANWEPVPDTILYSDLWNGVALDGGVVSGSDEGFACAHVVNFRC
jgi:hypothetical protein